MRVETTYYLLIMTYDLKYLRRALELAAMGAGHVSPNPMVGAVIVSADGRIIGEGFHRHYGGPHAEVNAFASVLPEDEHLFPESTIYVTLEPCSHYGKTPPCADLLVAKGIGRCVVGTTDPNPKVSGRGIRRLRDAGIEVISDIMRDECRAINVRFFTAHTLHRPWIQLKWAQDAQGQLALPRPADSDTPYSPLIISSPLTMALMHRERSMCDAIMVGTDTLLLDRPSLTTRLWPGHSPRPVIFDSPRLAGVADTLSVMQRDPVILDPAMPLEENMHRLYTEHGITSLMVEGGPTLLRSFLDARLYDDIRIEHKSLM